MRKIHKMRKAWKDNYKLWMIKGVYVNGGKPIKEWLTPKQVIEKYFKSEKK